MLLSQKINGKIFVFQKKHNLEDEDSSQLILTLL